MEALWPGIEARSAANNLHQILYAARRAFEPSALASSSATSGYLLLRDKQLILCADSPLWVDAEAFQEAAVTARHAMEVATFRAAIDLYAGDLLPGDRYEPWVQQRRAELRELYLSLLLELGGLLEERGEFGEAIEALGRIVAEEPTHEEAYVGLMRLQALSGRRGEALSQYERLREALCGQFGREPEAATTRLQQEIRTGTLSPSELPLASFPPGEATPSPTEAARHNLPPARTNLSNAQGDEQATVLCELFAGDVAVDVTWNIVLTEREQEGSPGQDRQFSLQAVVPNFGGGAVSVRCGERGDADDVFILNTVLTAIRVGTVE